MKSKIAIIILIILVIIEAIFILYFAGLLNRFIRNPRLLTIIPPVVNPLIHFSPNSIQGKITRVAGKIISIRDTQGTQGELELADDVTITPSPKDKQIVLDKDVLITVNKKSEDKYVVSSILYVPDNFQVPNSTKSASSPSASIATPAPLPIIVVPSPPTQSTPISPSPEQK